jgi:mono/diheme cytochrome c family protein
MLFSVNRKQMKVNFKLFAQFSMVTLVAAACTADPDSPGLEYMPDMYRSPAIEPYVDYGEVRGEVNNELKMTRSALVPPSFIIPYYGTDTAQVAMMLPYARKAGSAYGITHGLFQFDLSKNSLADFDYQAASVDLNPLKLKDAVSADKVFADAKTLYTNNCQHCHGEKGDGNGPMVLSGAYNGVPAYSNLTITEGQMFYSIYYGKNMMGAHNSILNKKEIWSLVHYIKRFQNADYGKFDAMGKAMSTATPAADSVSKMN